MTGDNPTSPALMEADAILAAAVDLELTAVLVELGTALSRLPAATEGRPLAEGEAARLRGAIHRTEALLATVEVQR